jgi:glyoxylase I family protein
MTARPAVWSHVALNCADQASTEEFYTRWFGFGRARVIPVPDGEIVFLRRGPMLLELFAAPGAAATVAQDGPHEPGTVRHIAFQTDDVDAFLAGMGDAADVSLGPLGFDEVIPGWRTVWLRDPDGVVVEVSQGYQDVNDQDADDQNSDDQNSDDQDSDDQDSDDQDLRESA